MIPLSAVLLLAVPQQSLSYPELLKEFTELPRLAATPQEGSRVVQFSSYDRKSQAGPGEPDAWFANDDRGHYLRVEDGPRGKEYVLAEVDGPAVITRLWAANPSGELRFYAAGTDEALLSLPFEKLVSGVMPPFGAPLCNTQAHGGECRVPLPFAAGFKLTATAGDLAYQVSVRRYPDGTGLPTLSTELLEEQAERIGFVNELLRSGDFLPYLRKQTTMIGRVMSGQFLEAHIRRAGTVQLLRVDLMHTSKLKDLRGMLRGLRLQLLADGEMEPQFDVPLGDLFGITRDPQEVDGYLLRVEFREDTYSFVSRVPVPFSSSLRIRLLNEALERPFLRLRAEFDTEEPQPLRLHGAWKLERGVTARPFRDYTILDANGPGRFVGCGLIVRNSSRAAWGEGDEKIFVDGESFPSAFGTGIQDYFGCSSSATELFADPFRAQLHRDGPESFGFTSAMRLHLGDAIPFQKSFRFDVGLRHDDPEAELDLTSFALWYAPIDAGHAMPPMAYPEMRELLPLPPVPGEEDEGE